MDFFIKMKVTKKKRLLTANILFKTGVFFNKYELFALRFMMISKAGIFSCTSSGAVAGKPEKAKNSPVYFFFFLNDLSG